MKKNLKLSCSDQIRKISPLATLFQIYIGRSRKCNKTKKEIKYIQMRKGEIQLSLFTNGIVIYLENLKKN